MNTSLSTSPGNDWQNLDTRTLNYAASSLLSPLFSNSFANVNYNSGGYNGLNGYSSNGYGSNSANNSASNGTSQMSGNSTGSYMSNHHSNLHSNHHSNHHSNPFDNSYGDPYGQMAPRSCPPIGQRETFGFRQFTGMTAAANNSPSSYVPPRVRRRQPTCIECVFCKNNGQPPSFYKSHVLKDPEGNIKCPVLRNYDCPICHNNGGDRAHTLRYCPLNKPSFWQKTRPA